MELEPLAVGLRLLVGLRREVGVHAGGRRGDDLTKKVFADEFAALGRRGVGGLAGKRQEGGLPQDAGTRGIRGEVHAPELLRRGGQPIELREVAIYKAVLRGEQFHEVAIFPYQVTEEAARLLGHGGRKFSTELGEQATIAKGVAQAVEAQPFTQEYVHGLLRLKVI